ncbi:MAG: undecaprenyl/decaprenyl-phosphate alpha-N-acetylglucosaminyl 1-phosphate transferase, partial [Actinobacteria bacterium]|nr:undecaprenyl/decaprenyl-phosphate alpha-N-acetylglucosaminyl 1-phosphate transferase [Actinomycetota bacterium]
MREYLVTVLLAAIITYLVTPLVKDLAVKAGAVSAIRSRDVHLEPTPRWGGLAMWLS